MIRLLLAALLLLSCLPRPSVVVVPSDREVRVIPGQPGWYAISAGHLQELHDQQLLLVEALEQCRMNPAD